MSYPTVFHLIADTTKKMAVSCVLIGGFAVNYYKVTRQTADVDFLITEEDFKKLVPLLEKEGYKQDFFDKVFIRLKSNKHYLMDIDFMFVDKETLDKITKDAKKATIGKQKFMIPSLNNLIALKLHSLKYNLRFREHKDLPDIVNLIRVNKVNVQKKEFKKLCLKYGTEEIYSKIAAKNKIK